MVSAASDSKGRLIAIFAGAVILPSIALSVLSFDSIPKWVEAQKITRFKFADKALYYTEKELALSARARALEAARVVGTERLLDGRAEAIQAALQREGMGDRVFDTLRLEASSPSARIRALLDDKGRDADMLKEALQFKEPNHGPDGEDSVPLMGEGGEKLGILRFRFSCAYAHGTLLREYFENDPAYVSGWVLRVTEPEGQVLWENAPTPNGKFELKREMETPTFRGLRIYLRSKERSIEAEARRWGYIKMAMMVFIDLLLGAGLYLVFTNMQREARLARLKSDFVANVSHELKTPLALIRLFAETLELGRVQNDEKAQQYYHVINKESHRLTQLINNILDFSRIEAGRKEYRFAPTDVAQVVREVLEAYRFPIEQQGFSLQVDIANDLPEAEVDKEALSQALINLVNNAIKYSRDDKYLRLEVKPAGDRLLLSVADHGIGVAPAEQDKIFEKFYRAEDSLVHETKGSGLGLALIKHIMEAHGGRVELESTPGKGSTFTLSLPLKRRGVPAAEGRLATRNA